jgi:hypothetical protein
LRFKVALTGNYTL